MSIPILKRRKYNVDDATMLSFCDTTLVNFTNNQGAFTAFDSNLNAGYAGDFTDAINLARNFETDDQHIDIMAQLTMDLEAKMVECRDVFHIAKYFIERAFPNKPGRWNEFGFNDYDRCRNDHEKMIQFMTSLHASLEKYDTELLAVGYTAPKMATVATRRDQLIAANTAQELSKGERTHSTNQRIQELNSVYDMLMRICTAGKIQFAGNYGLYQLFLLPWGSGSSGGSNQIIEDTITGTEIKNVAIPTILPETELTFINLGLFDLHFYFAETAASPSGNPPVIVIGGATEIVAADNIGLDGTHTFLNVKMPVGTSCEYKVEWI